MERLNKIGTLPRISAKDTDFSRLGLGFEKLDRDVFDPEKAYDKVAALGVKRIRIQSGWLKTERERGVYSFEWLDKIVDNLIERGLEPWMCLCYGNPLYTPAAAKRFGGVSCPPIDTEEEREAWSRYVSATVAHFKGRVDMFEIWNEPEIYFGQTKMEWDLTPSDMRNDAVKFAEFSIATAKAIKAGNAEAKVVGGALCITRLPYFLNTAMAMGLHEYVDYISFHIYSQRDWQREGIIHSLRALIDQYNPNIKIIQGESGAPSRGNGNGAMGTFAWSREKQAKYLSRMMITDLAGGVEFSSYFSTMDMIEGLHGVVGQKKTYLDYGYFGVIGAEFDEDGFSTGEYKEKPSYFALAALCSLLRGKVKPVNIALYREYNFSPRLNTTEAEESVKTYAFELEDGSHAVLYWNATNILTSTYEGTVSFSVCGQTAKDIRLVDMLTGDIYELPEDMVEDVGEGCVRLINLPLLDSPLALLLK